MPGHLPIRTYTRLFGALALVCACLTLTGPARAGEVRKVHTKKKTVLINIGRKDGLKKKMRVCFYKTSAKEKKLACGKVIKMRKKKSVVRIKSNFGKVQKGFYAEKNPVKKKKAKGGARPYDIALRGFWLPYFTGATPATFNLLSYNGANADETGSLWKTEGTYESGLNSSIFLSLGGEVEILDWGTAFGGHFKTYSPFAAEADYSAEASQKNLFIFNQVSASSFGLYADYKYRPIPSIAIGAGLDIDITSLTFQGTKKDDNGTEPDEDLFAATGSATIISLRLPAQYDYFIGPVGITLGLNILVPLAAVGAAVTAEAADPLNGSKVTDPNADLATAIGLDKGSLGIEAVMGLFWGF